MTGYGQLLTLHIVAGCVALVSGAAALGFRKGSAWHRYSGRGFVGSVAAMLGSAAVLSVYLERYSGLVGIVLFLYLATSAWHTAYTRGRAGRFEQVSLPVPVACAILLFYFGLRAVDQPPGTLPPVGMLFFLSIVASAAAIGDALYLRRRTLNRTSRLSRHIWRMSVALFAASGSFFLGQAEVFPSIVQEGPLLPALAVAPLLFMVYWLVALRITSRATSSHASSALIDASPSSEASGTGSFRSLRPRTDTASDR